MNDEIVNPKTESRIEHLDSGTYKITLFCCKYEKSFIYFINKWNPELHDIIIDCLYDYCKTGEIKFKKPKGLKNLTDNYISKFIIQAIENEKNNQSFIRNVRNTEIREL